MIAGQLKERIEIYVPKVVLNEYGEQSRKYVFKTKTRAKLLHSGGAREVVNDEMFYPYQKTLQVRFYVNVCDLDIIKWDGKYYKILEIAPEKERQYKQIRIELMND